MRKTAARKTTLQMVQGFLSKKKLVRYRTINIAWLYIKAGFNGFGMRRTGMSHCKQYISAGHSSRGTRCCALSFTLNFSRFLQPTTWSNNSSWFLFSISSQEWYYFFCPFPLSLQFLIFQSKNLSDKMKPTSSNHIHGSWNSEDTQSVTA